MHIGIIGLNHKSADLRLREKFAKACQRRFTPGRVVHPQLAYVLLSTCNRTEIYFSGEDLASLHTYLFNILRQEIEGEFEHKIYSYFGRDCFFHLARVVSGMDSAIPCETEIQHQVKQAYESSTTNEKLSSELHFLFQKCLKIGKDVRSTLPFTLGLPSLEETIIQVASQLFIDLKNRSILFVGVSEINYKIFSRFKQKGFLNITFCNRTLENARPFVEKENLSLLPWDKLKDWSQYDLIIFGTKATDFLLTKDHSSQVISTSKLLIDLSVPRNVDPHLGRNPYITLLNIDQLNRGMDRKRMLKALEIARIESQLIASAVDKQVACFRLKSLSKEKIFPLASAVGI